MSDVEAQFEHTNYNYYKNFKKIFFSIKYFWILGTEVAETFIDCIKVWSRGVWGHEGDAV